LNGFPGDGATPMAYKSKKVDTPADTLSVSQAPCLTD
jgi:hypothetical protein